MKFSIKDFLSKCGQIRSILRIWSHLLTKSLMENFIFGAVFKAHGYDDISIRMIKICDNSVTKPLIILFKNSTKSCYPDIWKRSNIIPAHKKNDKQLVNNYRPISLLPIFEKKKLKK